MNVQVIMVAVISIVTILQETIPVVVIQDIALMSVMVIHVKVMWTI